MTPVPDRLAAALAGRYSIERELGQGGMATVYLALDLKHNRKVAIKVLREDLAASMGSARFLREIEIAAQLQHPNILPLLDSGDADGFLYYVMPFVSGQSLRERLGREGELPVHEAVRLITEVVDALAHAHDHGVVHRDIKPDNVMISGRHALVADFGVAKAISEASGRNTVTTLGVAVGTPAYMSPEQAAADPHVDHRSDIYAVGVMLYEMLSGRPPFVGATPQQVLAAHVTEDPDPVTKRRPAIPPTLESVVMRCLAKRPADRFQSAGDLLAQLETLATPSGGITPSATRPISAVAPVKRALPWRPIGVGIAAIVVLGGLAYWRYGAVAGGASSAHAIAVLPFDNSTRDTSVDYLADGIANDVRSALTTLPGLTVKARTSSAAAKGKPIRDVGTLLNVDAVLQGEYRRAGDRVTVTVDLVKVSDESALWSHDFVLPANGNFSSAQDSITHAVATALHLQTGASKGAEVQRGTSDLAAYDLYLKGQFLFSRRGGDNLFRAIAFFKEALARDPRFARADAGLAMTYTILGGYAQVENVDSIGREAEKYARAALAIDSTLLDGHLALANSLTAQGRPGDAEAEFKVAVALDPRNALAHEWRGANLNVLGRGDEAVQEGRAAVEMDPLSAVAASDLAYDLVGDGKYADAVTAGRRVMELNPAFSFADEWVGIAYAAQGRADSAAAAFARLFNADSLEPEARAYNVWRYVFNGDLASANREVTTLEHGAGGSSNFDAAIGNLAVGNRTAALEHLEHASERGLFYMATSSLGCDPTFASLRSDPRFIAITRRMGQAICTRADTWPVAGSAKH